MLPQNSQNVSKLLKFLSNILPYLTFKFIVGLFLISTELNVIASFFYHIL